MPWVVNLQYRYLFLKKERRGLYLHRSDGGQRTENSTVESLFNDVGDGQGSEIRARVSKEDLSWLDGWDAHDLSAPEQKKEGKEQSLLVMRLYSHQSLIATAPLTLFVLACSRPEALVEGQLH